MAKNGFKEQTVNFKFERSTPGAHRYQEVDGEGEVLKGDADGALMGTVYFRKVNFGETAPKELVLTIKSK